MAEEGCEGSELAIVADGDDQRLIGAGEGLVGHEIGVAVALTRGAVAADQIVAGLVGEHGEAAVEQRTVDGRPLPRRAPADEGGEDGVGGVEAGEEVDDGDPGTQGAAVLDLVGEAGDAHQAGLALDHEVVAGLPCARAVLAEAGDAGVDEAGVSGAKGGGVEAAPGEARRP